MLFFPVNKRQSEKFSTMGFSYIATFIAQHPTLNFSVVARHLNCTKENDLQVWMYSSVTERKSVKHRCIEPGSSKFGLKHVFFNKKKTIKKY